MTKKLSAETGKYSSTGSSASFTKDDLLQILSRQTEAGNALVTAGLVEDWLEKLLLAGGRPLTDNEAKRVLGGPLKYFKPKIDVAYMFGLIEPEVRNDLRTIADIRNAFAHTTRFVYFNSEHIAKLCRQLSSWRSATDNQTRYRDAALDCINAMKARVDRIIYEQALSEEPLAGEADADSNSD
ncbi:hypothetical protein [Bradyrhizobium guangdongense]|uniref:Transcriptional regulator n=1 Tax=Bradyrhizobium guangdongense TaxID=1325090 RepID=A0A410V7E2_9BRAD|nr:hypothetical protein [Bradyrhizobium guangdongense]QAU39599.1 hypothetical protein X265_19475 [Bradyrhizobium guangdongense]QOZ60660.1 hypothetical protein XH86_19485 [Bradyrhizobium guangdongense]GGI24159.1 hypothetical protein GCM10010987_27990 [Bradyrhizobium guangdongense]